MDDKRPSTRCELKLLAEMVPSRRTPLSGLLAVLLFTLASAKECIVLHTEGLDDSSNILAAFKECAQDSVITFQQTNYSAYTPVTLSELSKPHLACLSKHTFELTP